ncbi:MAG: cohesin domain-containing protein [Clostridia bacterium]
MKKNTAIIALLLAVVLVVSFSACKGSENNPSNSPSSSQNPDQTGKSPTTTTTITPRPTIDPSAIDQETPENPMIMSIDSAEAKVGEKITLTVSLDNSAKWTWCSFEFTINFDPAKLKMISATTTDLTKDMYAAINPNYAEGKGKIVCAAGNELTGDGAICTIEFEALATGTSDITLTDALMFRFVTSGEATTTMPIKLTIVNSKITIG